MTIQVGETVPSVTLKVMGAEGLEDLDFAAHIAGKNIVIFGVPGAFTPTCSQQHLPGYIDKADEIKGQGVDEIICIAVNDPFVMKQWSEEAEADGKVSLISDGNAELTKALGLDIDLSAAGLGTRCKRFSMIVENAIVTSIEIEDDPGVLTTADAATCVLSLSNAKAA